MIVFDLQALQSAVHGDRGIGRYVGDLARALLAEHPGAVDRFAWNDRLLQSAAVEELGAAGAPLIAFSELAEADVDVLHVNSAFEPLPIDALLPPVAPRRLIVTVYDLIPYRFPDVYLADAAAAARYRTRLGMLATADAVVTDSRSAADDLVELVGIDRRRITVIGAGVDARFRPPKTTADAARQAAAAVPGLESGFVLVPSGMDWRKNAERTVAAYAGLDDQLRQRHQLVLATGLQPGYEAWLRQLAADAGIADRLVLPGHVDDDTLVALYQSAELVCMPSLYEGFGLPVLEALHCGARVIASEMSSLPEIVRDRTALFDPWDTAAITAVLQAALRDPTIGARLTEERFTWSAAASRLVHVYRRVATV